MDGRIGRPGAGRHPRPETGTRLPRTVHTDPPDRAEAWDRAEARKQADAWDRADARGRADARDRAEHGADADLLAALRGLPALSAVDEDLRPVLGRLAALVVQGIAAAHGASIAVGRPDEPELLASSGRSAQAADGAQHHAGVGPSWDAYGSGRPVCSARFGADARWPGLAAPAGTDGVLALPIDAAGSLAGVLALYGDAVLGDPAELPRALPFAAAAGTLLHVHGTIVDLRRQDAQLRDALVSRAVIDQAKGILMARLGLSPEDAFAELTRLSQHANVKLREIARRLVAEVSSPPTP